MSRDIVESPIMSETGESTESVESEAHINVPIPIVKEMEGYLDRRASAENSSVLSVLEAVLRKAIRQESQLVGNFLTGGPSYVEHPGSTQAYASGRPKVDWENVRTRLYVRVTDAESRELSTLAKDDKSSISEVAYGLVLRAIRDRRERIRQTQ
jgi:hypothetical protein